MLRKLCSAILGLFLGSGNAVAGQGSAWDYTFTSIDGTPMPLQSYAGHVVLVVNTASRCGFTPQYEGLEKIWNTYKDRGKGLVVIGVPSNDFGEQEPGSNPEIKTSCETTFNVSFPLTERAVVSGDHAHPFYQWAAQQTGAAGIPRWNFHKYLIGPDGRLLDWFLPTTKPDDPKITGAIEMALNSADPD
ncbi:glutathione peroxidase [Haematospirillum jordaniae]|uniref:glutathione peroxidase n=1 Tax=Haematospirillum jordaniae TaxID=1549855 RepID=UPI0014330F97|nr:glutathione peroxidase [Haematospirillum jordaniae]NKD86268.1 glutathione peroxidase [Haematospirillum jordaniae]